MPAPVSRTTPGCRNGSGWRWAGLARSTCGGTIAYATYRSSSRARSTVRPTRRLATYASPVRIGPPTLPQAANNDKPRAPVIMSGPVRPPLVVVLVAVVVIALGETAGGAMSRLRPQIERYAAA